MFGGSYGMGRSAAGGGGGSGGGGMMRTVGRMMRTGLNGLQDSVPSSTSSSTKNSSSSATKTTQKQQQPTSSKHALTVSSVSPSPYIAAAWSPPLYDYYSVVADDSVLDQWECVENYFDDYRVFGDAPSSQEVQHALLSLQQVIHPPSPSVSTTEKTPDLDKDTAAVKRGASSNNSDVLDWIEPSMQIYDGRLVRYSGWENVYDAFHLLRTEPSVQRMVLSLSSDRAVWDAVLNNEAVREIRESYRNAAEISSQSSGVKSDPSDVNPNVLKWIFDNMKEKLLEIIGTITKIVGEIFKPLEHEKIDDADHAFSEKLKSTFLLTIVVLLVVVVARGHMT